jgi:hypothetical protein
MEAYITYSLCKNELKMATTFPRLKIAFVINFSVIIIICLLHMM